MNTLKEAVITTLVGGVITAIPGRILRTLPHRSGGHKMIDRHEGLDYRLTGVAGEVGNAILA